MSGLPEQRAGHGLKRNIGGNGPLPYTPGAGGAEKLHAISELASAHSMHTQRAVQGRRVASGPPLYSKHELRRNYVYRGTGEDTLTPEGTFLPGWSDREYQGRREYAAAQPGKRGTRTRGKPRKPQKLKVNDLPRCPVCGLLVSVHPVLCAAAPDPGARCAACGMLMSVHTAPCEAA